MSDKYWRNEKNYNSTTKSNYHHKRRNSGKAVTSGQRNYSSAFVHGDTLAANGMKPGDSYLLEVSRDYKTKYEKKSVLAGCP